MASGHTSATAATSQTDTGSALGSVPSSVWRTALAERQATVPPVPVNGAPGPELESGERTSLADVERAHIERVLRQMDGNVTRTATALGIDRRTLQRKLKAYGLSAETD